MFNIGSQELLVILLAVLLLFGAKRIPEVSRALGKGLGDFRDALSGVERELKGESVRRVDPPLAPLAPPRIQPPAAAGPVARNAAAGASVDSLLVPPPSADPSPETGATSPHPGEVPIEWVGRPLPPGEDARERDPGLAG